MNMSQQEMDEHERTEPIRASAIQVLFRSIVVHGTYLNINDLAGNVQCAVVLRRVGDRYCSRKHHRARVNKVEESA